MKKTLTVIVPTYNMEAYLERCLQSVTNAPDALERLDIIVVNDGSTDHSSHIAHNFAERFPHSVRVIDKPNGNYGSTVNAALQIAAGTYIKLLDADDRFNTEHLTAYINALDNLPEVDMAISPFTQVTASGTQNVHYDMYSRRTYRTGRLYSAEQIFADGKIRFFMMHSLAYRTALLREMDYHQTEGVSYTDQEWGFYPLLRIRTVAFINENLYRYDLTREGQTMDPKVMARSIAQLETVTDRMLEYYEHADTSNYSDVRRRFLRKFLQNRIRIIYRMYLMNLPEREYSAAHFAEVFQHYNDYNNRNFHGYIAVPVNRGFRFDLLRYYLRHGRRPGAVLRFALCRTDALMNRAYRLLYQ